MAFHNWALEAEGASEQASGKPQISGGYGFSDARTTDDLSANLDGGNSLGLETQVRAEGLQAGEITRLTAPKPEVFTNHDGAGAEPVDHDLLYELLRGERRYLWGEAHYDPRIKAELRKAFEALGG